MARAKDLVDEKLKLPKDLTYEDVRADEVARLQELFSLGTLAAAHPRRLGGDASREELARDKRVSRRMAHVAVLCLRNWGEAPGEPDPSLTPRAAQMDWDKWTEQRIAWLNTRVVYLVTWASRLEGASKLVNQLEHRIAMEVSALRFAMR